ncbi:uncharacterized protein LOC142090132 [Calonectris borealis]|uniref:uncharacterized protein LOC142090132 n=1 Tax=Calonectris borealis TaxID=1323832 RepID=UPI003F4B13FE
MGTLPLIEGASIDCGHGGAVRVSGGCRYREHRSQPGNTPGSGLLLNCHKSTRVAFRKRKLRQRAMVRGPPGKRGARGNRAPLPAELPEPFAAAARQRRRIPAARRPDTPHPGLPAPPGRALLAPSTNLAGRGPAGAPRLRPGAAGSPCEEGSGGGGAAGAGSEGAGAGSGGSEPRRVGGGAGLQPVFKFPSQELSSLEHARPGAARRVRAGAGPGERGVSRQPPQPPAPPQARPASARGTWPWGGRTGWAGEFKKKKKKRTKRKGKKKNQQVLTTFQREEGGGGPTQRVQTGTGGLSGEGINVRGSGEGAALAPPRPRRRAARPPELGAAPLRELAPVPARRPVPADPAWPRREGVGRQRLGPPLPARRRRSPSPPLGPPCPGPASTPCPSAGRCPGAAGSLPLGGPGGGPGGGQCPAPGEGSRGSPQWTRGGAAPHVPPPPQRRGAAALGCEESGPALAAGGRRWLPGRGEGTTTSLESARAIVLNFSLDWFPRSNTFSAQIRFSHSGDLHTSCLEGPDYNRCFFTLLMLHWRYYAVQENSMKTA